MPVGTGAQRTIVRGALRVEAAGHVRGDGWARGWGGDGWGIGELAKAEAAGHRSVGKGAQRTIVRGALRVEAAGHVSGGGWARGDSTPYVEKGVKKYHLTSR